MLECGGLAPLCYRLKSCGIGITKRRRAAALQNFSPGRVDLLNLIRRRVVGQKYFGGLAMKYILLIYLEEKGWAALTEQQRQDIYSEYRTFTEEIIASGNYISGSELHPVSTATSVRVRDGKVLSTDGPFAETKEQLGGYYLVEAKDLDEATALAARIPSATTGTVEVRPLAE
jgi:hypothetical protein